MCGQIFNIDGKRFFTMGRASSFDIDAGILELDTPELQQKRRLMDRQRLLYRVNHINREIC